MPDPSTGLATQVRNIEATYGKRMSEWFTIIGQSGLTKHPEIVNMLKTRYGLTHGAAHRVSLQYRESTSTQTPTDDPTDLLYSGKKAALRPIHNAVMDFVMGLGNDVVVTPKKGYLSIVRRKQFAMVQPSTATRLDVGIIRKDAPHTERFEDASRFNALFTHRVRLVSITDVDDELRTWLHDAYTAAR